MSLVSCAMKSVTVTVFLIQFVETVPSLISVPVRVLFNSIGRSELERVNMSSEQAYSSVDTNLELRPNNLV